jgi:hypothetical protein
MSAPGRLFVLIDIVRPWLAASQIGQALIHAFVSGYKDASRSADEIQRVEAALKRVNETLVHLTQQGETEWIGHLHAVFLLELLGEIHVAQTGRAAAYLLRDDVLSRMTDEEQPQSAAAANRTFANITSGSLAAGDGVILGSADFFRAIPPELAQDSLCSGTPSESVRRFVRLLRQQQVRGAAAIVAVTRDPLELENQPLNLDPEVLYLDEAPIESLASTLKRISRTGWRALERASHALIRASRVTRVYVRSTVAPRAALAAASAARASRASWHRFSAQTLPSTRAALQPVVARLSRAISATVNRRSNSTATDAPSLQREPTAALPSGASLLGKPLYTVHHYTQPRALWTVPIVRLIRVSSVFQALTAPRNRSRLYAVVAAILLVILGLNIATLRAKQRDRATSQAVTDRIGAIRKRVDQLSVQRTLDAASSSSELAGLVAELRSLDTSVAASVADSAEALLDRQTDTVRIKAPKRIATFSRPTQIARLGNDLVSLSHDQPTLASSPVAGELIDDRSRLQPDERTAFGLTVGTTGDLLVFTTTGVAYRLTQPGATPQLVTVDGDSWGHPVAGASFGPTLYLLDPSLNQIEKFAPIDQGFAAPTPFITDGTAVSNGRSIAIDGSIFVLGSNGTILKLTRGKRDGFSLRDLPPSASIERAVAIATNAENPSLFVLTPDAVVELTKTGQYLRRYVSADWTNLTSFIVDPIAKQAWVLNNDTVYELPLSNS